MLLKTEEAERAALEARHPTCRWVYQGGDFDYYETGCGGAASFLGGGRGCKGHDYIYCPYCGGKIEEASDEG